MSDNNRSDDSVKLLEETVKKYYPRIWENNFYLLHGSAIDADDVTQSVFTVLSEKWDKIDKKYVGAWLYGVSRRKLLEFFRKKKKDSENVISIEVLNKSKYKQLDKTDYDYPGPDDEIINRIKNEVLDMLSEKERKLYWEFFENGASYEELMRIYSISYSTAATRISRLREKLRGLITVKSSLFCLVGSAFPALTLYLIKELFKGR